MKKAIYTLSLLTVFAVGAKAQSPAAKQEPQEPKKETVTPEGAKANQPAPAKPAQAVKKEEKAEPKTRMAINEKGVPASKPATVKDKKEEKAPASPGQPTAAEKH